MPPVALVAASLADIAVGAIFAGVGTLVAKRHKEGAARVATTMFATWWYGIAGSTALGGLGLNGGLLGLAAAALGRDRVTRGWLLLVLLAWTLFACIGLFGLLVYLLYVYVGRLLTAALGAAYVALYALFAFITWKEDPSGLVILQWGVRVIYERPVEGLALAALLVLLVLPQIAGAAAYGSLYFQSRSPAVRYRTMLVSSALLVWLVSSLVAGIVRYDTTDAWMVAQRLVALAAAATIALAFAPPRIVAARLEQGGEEVGTGAS